MDDLYNDEHDEDDLPTSSVTRFAPPLSKRVSNDRRDQVDNNLLDRFNRSVTPNKSMESKTRAKHSHRSSAIRDLLKPKVGNIFIKQVFGRSKTTTMMMSIRGSRQDDKKQHPHFFHHRGPIRLKNEHQKIIMRVPVLFLFLARA